MIGLHQQVLKRLQACYAAGAAFIDGLKLMYPMPAYHAQGHTRIQTCGSQVDNA